MEKSKILYAEDDKTIAFLVEDSLESYYDISCYSDGELISIVRHSADQMSFLLQEEKIVPKERFLFLMHSVHSLSVL